MMHKIRCSETEVGPAAVDSACSRTLLTNGVTLLEMTCPKMRREYTSAQNAAGRIDQSPGVREISHPKLVWPARQTALALDGIGVRRCARSAWVVMVRCFPRKALATNGRCTSIQACANQRRTDSYHAEQASTASPAAVNDGYFC